MGRRMVVPESYVQPANQPTSPEDQPERSAPQRLGNDARQESPETFLRRVFKAMAQGARGAGTMSAPTEGEPMTPEEVASFAEGPAPAGGYSEQYDPTRVGPPGGNEITPFEVAKLGEQVDPEAKEPPAARAPRGGARGGAGGGGRGMPKVTPAVPLAADRAPRQGRTAALDGGGHADALKELRDGIEKIEKRHKIDLSPMLALTDTWTGGNLQKGYNRPMSEDERDMTVLELKQKLLGTQQGIDDKAENRDFMERQLDTQQKRWDEDRELREKLGLAKVDAQRAKAARGGAGGQKPGAAGKHIEATTKYLTSNKQAMGVVEQLASAQYIKRGPDGKPPKGARPSTAQKMDVAQRLAFTANYYEEQGIAPPGMGLKMAFQDMLEHPNGPSGGGGQKLEDLANGGDGG